MMKASEKYYGEQQELLGKLNGYVEEMYNGQSVVQTFNYQERAKKKFSQLNDALKNSSRNGARTIKAVLITAESSTKNNRSLYAFNSPAAS